MAFPIAFVAGEAARQAARIASLAQAANCIASGSTPNDPLVRGNILLDLLDVIEELACHAGDAMERIERETAKA